MNTVRYVAAALILGGALLVFFLTRSSTVPPSRPNVKAAIGVEENPRARYRYERRRLIDPRTGEIPVDIRRKELAFAATLPVLDGYALQAAAPWKQRGPSNIGGRTRALAVDVSDESRLLAGGVSGGMFLSEDGGQTWTQTFGPQQLHSVTSIAQDTRDGHTDTWYVGTGEYRGNSASVGGGFFRGDGIYKSTDGGETWRLLPSTSTDTPESFDNFFDYVWEVAVDPSNAAQGEVYAATYGRVYRSTDGGGSWEAVLKSRTRSQYSLSTDVQVTSTGVVYAALGGYGDETGVYRSATGALGSFVDITPAGFPAPGTPFGRIELAISLSDESEVWAVARTPGSGTSNHTLMRYDAGAGTWTDFSAYLPDRGGLTGSFTSQSGYDLVIAVHPEDGDLVFVGGRNLWRLDVAGPAAGAATWIGGYTPANDSYRAYPNHHPDQHALAFLPSDADVMYTGSDGGVHRTDGNRAPGDGGVTWVSLNDAYYTTQFYTVCFNADPGDPVIAGGMQDNGTWSTTSSSRTGDWQEELGGGGSDCAITHDVESGGTSRYVSAQLGLIYRLVYDESGAYQGFTRVDPAGASGYLFINPFALDPADPRIMYLPAGSSLWRNSNLEDIPLRSNASASTNWTEMSGSQISQGVYSAVAVSHETHRLYLGTSDGRVFRLDDAHTASASAVPVDVTSADFPGGYVSSIAVDPTDPDAVVVTFSNYRVPSIFYTADGGATWTDVSGSLEENPNGSGSGPSVRFAAILPNTAAGGTRYYAATSTGLYATSALDGSSTTWAQMGPETIGNVVVDQVRARPADGLVLVGTHANGVFSRTVPVRESDLLAFALEAGQEGSVTVRWTLASNPRTDRITIEQQYFDGPFAPVAAVEPSQVCESSAAGLECEVTLADVGLGAYAYRLFLENTQVPGDTLTTEARDVRIALQGFSAEAGNVYDGHHEAAIQWAVPPGTDGFDYVVEQCPGLFGVCAKDGSFQPVSRVDGRAGAAVYDTIVTVAEPGNYTYRLRMVDAQGHVLVSALSGPEVNEVTIPGLRTFAAEVALAPNASGNREITLRWTTPRKVDGVSYLVQQCSGAAGGCAEDAYETIDVVAAREGVYRYQATATVTGSGTFTYRVRMATGTSEGRTIDVKTVEASIALAGGYDLSPAYPNPFTQRTRIDLTVAAPQRVTVEVYDLLGRRVRTMYRDMEALERKALVIEGAGLAAGVYLVHVSGEGFTELRKIVVMW